MAALLQIFRAVAHGYRGLAAGDLSVKQSSETVLVVSQRKTTFCVQAGRCHTKATTSLFVCRRSVAVKCWSANCPRDVVMLRDELSFDNSLPCPFETLFPH
ncbi:hypothetical protein DIPPA_26760 [Diplonema papillatum]|nr:hypothetical protein DIPPA_26760 [Diplonema papillatum]